MNSLKGLIEVKTLQGEVNGSGPASFGSWNCNGQDVGDISQNVQRDGQGVPRSYVESITQGSEPVKIVNSSSDWSTSPTVTVKGQECYELQSGIYLIGDSFESGNIKLTAALGSTIVIKAINGLNSCTGLGVFQGQNCPFINISASTVNSLFIFDDNYHPFYLQIQGVAFGNAASFLPQGLFDVELSGAPIVKIVKHDYAISVAEQEAIASRGLILIGQDDQEQINVLYGTERNKIAQYVPTNDELKQLKAAIANDKDKSLLVESLPPTVKSVTTVDMGIVIDNIYTGFSTDDGCHLGSFDGGASSIGVIIKNSAFSAGLTNSDNAFLSLKNVRYASVYNNSGAFRVGAARRFFYVSGSGTTYHTYANNALEDNNGSAVCPVFAILNDIPVDAKIDVSNHFIGQKANASYFDDSSVNNLTDEDARINVANCYNIQNSLNVAEAADVTGTVYPQNPIATANVPQLYDTKNAGNWSIIRQQGFTVTVGSASTTAGTTATETVIVQSEIPYDVDVIVDISVNVEPPSNSLASIGIMINISGPGGTFVPVADSFSPVENGNLHLSTIHKVVKMGYQHQIAIGIISSASLTSAFDSSNPRISVQR